MSSWHPWLPIGRFSGSCRFVGVFDSPKRVAEAALIFCWASAFWLEIVDGDSKRSRSTSSQTIWCQLIVVPTEKKICPESCNMVKCGKPHDKTPDLHDLYAHFCWKSECFILRFTTLLKLKSCVTFWTLSIERIWKICLREPWATLFVPRDGVSTFLHHVQKAVFLTQYGNLSWSRPPLGKTTNHCCHTIPDAECNGDEPGAQFPFFAETTCAFQELPGPKTFRVVRLLASKCATIGAGVGQCQESNWLFSDTL